MKQGITITREYDYHGILTVRIQKRRGKLGLGEIEDLLRYGDGQKWCGHCAILLNCSEATIEGSAQFTVEEILTRNPQNYNHLL